LYPQVSGLPERPEDAKNQVRLWRTGLG